LHSDYDLWHPSKLQRQVKRFEGGDPDLGLVYSWYRLVDSDVAREAIVYVRQSTVDQVINNGKAGSDNMGSSSVRDNSDGPKSTPLLPGGIGLVIASLTIAKAAQEAKATRQQGGPPEGQTATATPAKPGDLHWTLDHLRTIVVKTTPARKSVASMA
jgi:hypothetical protein